MKKMTFKEFKEVLKKAETNYGVFGFEGVLNLMSMTNRYLAENTDRPALKTSTNVLLILYMKNYRKEVIMSKIEEILAEIRLIRIRRQEIVAEPHPSKYLKEYIGLMRREVEALNEIQKERMRDAIITYALEDNRALEKLKKEVFRGESYQ